MDTDNMPETQQPQPGPSPTPSPKPAAAIEIGAINKFEDGSGAMIVPVNTGAGLVPFFVPQDYLEICQPEAGGFFCVFPTVTCFMSASAFEERYG